MSAESLPQEGEGCLVVGVGASAGGVEALEHLFSTMPRDIHAAFVVVTHLSPSHPSMLSEILARHTSIPVQPARNGEEIRSGHIYVLATDAVPTLVGHKLVLDETKNEARPRNPIDVFFASLAGQHRENAVGVVLSGAGNDGTLGLKSIKEQGGLTIAQGHDEAGPRHTGMPDSAISSGLVDLILPVDQMGSRLSEYARTFASLRALADADEHRKVPEALEPTIKEIYAILRKRVGHDFEGYKIKTFVRRLQRRIHVLQEKNIADYAERLRHDGGEANALFRDLLIGVTSFFRDGEAFEVIRTKVIPRLFDNAGVADTVRVWVPGCSTGEEAYSIAILLCEHMANLSVVPKVQVFATDIDEAALTGARAGRYPPEMLESVSPQRLKQFFRAESGSYVLTKSIRDLCIFSSHSVIRDPPFSRMDFVSCRNLLIYFNAGLQDDVLPTFHYSLKPGGFLFLGPSESASRHEHLFTIIDKKHRIFQRRPNVASEIRMPSWVPQMRSTFGVEAAAGAVAGRTDQRLRQRVEQSVLEQFAPAHILVESDGNIVFYSGRTGKYLEPQMGSPSRQLVSMARKELRLELRTALREAVEKQQTVVREHVELEFDNRVQMVRLTVQPLRDGDQDPLYLVVFTDSGLPLTKDELLRSRPAGLSSDVEGVEQELRETRERLQSTIEEYETALEELKSGNEELVSVNEELQSTNEELETSKEELQSVNEELHTVNQELAIKVDELHRANADLTNLFESAQIATIFLDRKLIIRNYTPAVTAIFNLIAGDRGRPITDIAHQLEDVDIGEDVRQVLDRGQPIERPVRLRHGKVYHLMRIFPYRTLDNEIDGALITFVNVTAVVLAEEQQRLLVSELNHRVRNMLQVVIGLCSQTLHRSADLKEFEAAFIGRVQALARAYHLVSREGWRNVPLLELLTSQLSPFTQDGQRYSTSGDPVILKADAALAFGLVLYELATNATKYGALSVDSGRIDISWKLRPPERPAELVLEWKEQGGPPVQEPKRHGFGSELVRRQLRYELSGSASMDFEEAGLRVTLAVSAEEAVEAGNAGGRNAK